MRVRVNAEDVCDLFDVWLLTTRAPREKRREGLIAAGRSHKARHVADFLRRHDRYLRREEHRRFV